LFWPLGSELTFSFLKRDRCDTIVQDKFRRYLAEWQKHVNLKLTIVDEGNDNAFVTISCSLSAGSYSLIGIDSLNYKPSMNLAISNRTTDETEFSRSMLHEIGHALGFEHEHLNPAISNRINCGSKIVLKKAEKENMTPAELCYSLKSELRDGRRMSAFDKKSIMLYSLPASLTGLSEDLPNNFVLSVTDIEKARKAYPLKNNNVCPLGYSKFVYGGFEGCGCGKPSIRDTFLRFGFIHGLRIYAIYAYRTNNMIALYADKIDELSCDNTAYFDVAGSRASDGFEVRLQNAMDGYRTLSISSQKTNGSNVQHMVSLNGNGRLEFDFKTRMMKSPRGGCVYFEPLDKSLRMRKPEAKDGKKCIDSFSQLSGFNV
jgi:serralysin